MDNKLYYKLVCIDQQHASLAEMQLNQQDKIKAKCLGRAVIVSINTVNIDPKELSKINYLLSSVRVHAMAFDDKLSQYDINEIDKI